MLHKGGMELLFADGWVSTGCLETFVVTSESERSNNLIDGSVKSFKLSSRIS